MAGISFYKENTDNHPVRTVIIWCVDILVVAAAAIIIVSQVFNTVRMSGRSMEPALANGDRLMMSRLTPSLFAPDRFDLVEFTVPDDERDFIRRIIALPGERVKIADGVIYINDEPLTDKFTGPITIPGVAENEITLGEDEYFVLGDNANSSEDSRFPHIGNIRERDIRGVIWFRYAPLERLSPVK